MLAKIPPHRFQEVHPVALEYCAVVGLHVYIPKHVHIGLLSADEGRRHVGVSIQTRLHRIVHQARVAHIQTVCRDRIASPQEKPSKAFDERDVSGIGSQHDHQGRVCSPRVLRHLGERH